MNDLEVRGLKDLIKEVMQEELEDLKADIQELRDGQSDSGYQDEEEDDDMPDQDDEPEPDLPPAEPLKDNPKRKEYEEDLEKASEKESGTRLNKEDMDKIKSPPSRKLQPKVPQNNEEWYDETE